MSPLAVVPGTTRRPATTGAKMTDAPMVATQPPRTAPHEVAAGRIARSEFAMTDLLGRAERRGAPLRSRPWEGMHILGRTARGQAARRALPSLRPRGPAWRRDPYAPRGDRGRAGRSARRRRSAGRSGGAVGNAR